MQEERALKVASREEGMAEPSVEHRLCTLEGLVHDHEVAILALVEQTDESDEGLLCRFPKESA